MQISPFATTKTRNMYQGKPAGDPDMTKKYPPKKRNNTADPARTRDGAKYPGGRSLRRAFQNLTARKKQNYKPGEKQPGSMK